MKVAVLMATYNGASYVIEQISSIENQSISQIEVILSDDGSSDATVELLGHEGSYPNNFCFVRKGGHLANFSHLVNLAKLSTNEYFAFSDQDDVWHSKKVELMLNRLKELEKLHDVDTPILVHCDLRVVDERLNEIAPSFVHHQGLGDPNEHDFPEFCYKNVVTGCATLFNRALLDTAGPIPTSAVIHDFWFGLCAKYFGILDYMDIPLIDYRQHGKNAVGATSIKEQTSFFKPYIYKMLLQVPKNLSQAIEQSKAIILRGDAIGFVSKDKNAVDSLQKFATLKEVNLISRLRLVSFFFPKIKHPLKKMYLYTVFAILPILKSRK